MDAMGVELASFVKVMLFPLLVGAYLFYRSAQQAATDLTLGEILRGLYHIHFSNTNEVLGLFYLNMI